VLLQEEGFAVLPLKSSVRSMCRVR